MFRSRRSSISLFSAAFLLILSARAPAQQTVEGSRLKLNGAELEVGGQVQTQFNTTTVDTEPNAAWLLRRVRLQATVRVNDLVSGKIQPDFAGNRVSIRDAYLKLSFDPGFQLLAGQAYRPFSLLAQTSSARILPVERGARIRGITAIEEQNLVNDLEYGDRDIGLQLMGAPAGAPLGFAYAAGVFQGPLEGGVGNRDSYQLAARATVRPAEIFQLGFGWSSRDFADPLAPEAGAPVLERGNAYELDLEIGSFSPGFHLLGEVAVGDLNPFEDSDFRAAHAWLAYRTGPLGRVSASLEPVFRVSYADLEEGVDTAGGTLFTPGLNVYFGGLNRLMLNYDVWSPDGAADPEGSFKAMFQLAF